jgi:hypothetical protein
MTNYLDHFAAYALLREFEQNDPNRPQLEAMLLVLRQTHKPHRLCKLVDGSLWEYISLPWIECGYIWVDIRKPVDPTTLRTVEAFSADPEHRDCLCFNAEWQSG